MKKKLIDKKITKLSAGKCYFCEVKDYAQLHVHRIIYGEDGGEYTDHNSLVVCANCHARIHDDQIVIDRKYNTTNGTTILHFWDEDEEKWV